MVSQEDLEQFCNLLQALLSTDNNSRRESETVYKNLKNTHPDRLCQCLIAVLTEVRGDILRQQSAVLLRQCFRFSRSDFIWPQLQPDTQELVKERLIVALRSEQIQGTRHKICDVVSALACHVLDPGVNDSRGWAPVRKVLAEFFDAGDSASRESALRIVRDMVSAKPLVAAELTNSQLGFLLKTCYADSSTEVRREAVLLFCASLEHLHPTIWEPLKVLIPDTLGVVQQFERSEANLCECLQAFVQAADTAPIAFHHHLGHVVPMMQAIARASASLGDGARQMAFEFLLSLSAKRAKMCARHPNFVQEMVHICMEFMLEIEDEPGWASQERRDDVEVSNHDVGEEAIDRFARSMGGEVVLDHVFAKVEEFVRQENWKARYVAIMTISQCVENVVQSSHVDSIVQLLLSMVQDAHPRVRYAALHAIGQASTDHSPYLQDNHHEPILQAIIKAMDDQVHRVAAHACAAFSNFGEELGREVLLPFVPILMEKLIKKMHERSLVTRQQAITAIAVIAGVTEVYFVPYYDTILPNLKQVVVTATSKEEQTLRGKAFECISLLGIAVGRQKFRADAQEIMQAMMMTVNQGISSDDPQRTYIHEASQRICTALREDFLPYIPQLLPALYKMLQIQPVEVADPEAIAESGDVTMNFLQDGTAIGLKTSQIEDFRSAVQMFGTFFEALGGHFFDHIKETAQHLLPALTFRLSDDVKREALGAWQAMIKVAKEGLQKRGIADTSIVADLLRVFLEHTLGAMVSETDIELLQVQASGAAACINAAGLGMMGAADIERICFQVQRLLEESSQRTHAAASGVNQPDDDERAEAEHQRDADQLLQYAYTELLGAVMATHKSHFLSGGLQHLMPVVRECSKTGRSSSDRCLAFYLAADIMEKLGVDGTPAWSSFMGPALESITDSDEWVRQAAAYVAFRGAAVAEFGEFAEHAARQCAQVISGPDAKQKGKCEATEAAVAALGKLCQQQGSRISSADVYLRLWLDNLPLTHDLDLAAPTHELLLTLACGGHPLCQQNIAQVFRVLAEVYGRDTSSDVLNAGIRSLFAELGQERLQHLQAPFTEVHRQRAHRILSDGKKST